MEYITPRLCMFFLAALLTGSLTAQLWRGQNSAQPPAVSQPGLETMLQALAKDREALLTLADGFRRTGEQKLGAVDNTLRTLLLAQSSTPPPPPAELMNGAAVAKLQEEIADLKKRLFRDEYQLRWLRHVAPREPRARAVLRNITSAQYLTDYAFAKTLKNNISLSGSGGEATAAVHAKKPLCSHVKEVFPGRPFDVSEDVTYKKRTSNDILQWRPDGNCRLHGLTVDEVDDCFNRTNIVLMGDSLLRESFEVGLRTLGVPVKLFGPPPVPAWDIGATNGWYYRNARYYFIRAAAEPTYEEAWDYNDLRPSLRKAKVVIIHHALHDMGIFCRGGIMKHLEGLKKRAADARELAGPKVRIIFLGLRWLFPERSLYRLPSDKKHAPHAYYYNTRKRAQTFRASIRAAAACAGAEYLPIEDLWKRLPHTSYDGLHQTKPNVMYSDLLFGSVCPRGGQSELKLMKGDEIGNCERLTLEAQQLAKQQEMGDNCLDNGGPRIIEWMVEANGTVPNHILEAEAKKATSRTK